MFLEVPTFVSPLSMVFLMAIFTFQRVALFFCLYLLSVIPYENIGARFCCHKLLFSTNKKKSEFMTIFYFGVTTIFSESSGLILLAFR